MCPDNLIDWRGPFHAAAMDNSWATGDAGRDSEIHASDFKYINGTFHHYWSVNFRDLRQIGHAVSHNPLGPYIEPVKDKWFSGRIDPYLFIDDDGKMYFYTVKFTDGNVIWGRRMDDPWTLTGEPV